VEVASARRPGAGHLARQRQADILMERLLGAAGHLVLNIRRMGVALVPARSQGERLLQGCPLQLAS